jgi:hypothetical protein
MVARLAIVLVFVGTGSAYADSAKLGDARHALDDVHYDDAQRLLVEAIKEGGNSAAAMSEIYQLSASTAVVLGHADAGEQYYRRWLALDPNAHLPDSVSPKLREPFVAAQAEMAAKGAIAVSATQIDARTVDVAVVSDPLAMARGACAIAGGAMVPFDGRGHAQLAVTDRRVAVCDESNNRLVEVNVTALSMPTVVVDNERPSAFKRESTWWIIGGVTGGAALICLGLAIQSSNSIADGGSGHTNTGLVIGASITGGVAVGALVFAGILHYGAKDPPRVVAAPTRDGATLSILGRF